MTTTRHLRHLAAALTLAAGLGLASCGSSGDSAQDTTQDTTLSMTGDEVSVSGQWARTSAMATTMGAVYLDIVATAGDTLTGVKVDPAVAAAAEIHETVMVGDHSMSTDTTMAGGSSMSTETTMAMSGEMKMQKIDSLRIPAGETFSLEPGGHHIMLIDLVEPLETGSTFPVTLSFETAGDVTVDVPVRDEAP